jgi:hypothetical protein
MGMTPDEFFESFVEGNRFDCHESPGDVRRAFNAAVAASHFADQYFTFNKRHSPSLVSAFGNIGAFVEHLTTETNGAFRDIRSISNAYKHLYTDITDGTSAFSSVDSSGAIVSLELFDDHSLTIIEGEYPDNAPGDDNRCKVVFTRKDGPKAEFLPTLDRVVDHLHSLVWGVE